MPVKGREKERKQERQKERREGKESATKMVYEETRDLLLFPFLFPFPLYFFPQAFFFVAVCCYYY